VILDTGVDPSVIDIGRANALGIRIDRGSAGEVSGVGDAKSAQAFPTTIESLAIGGRSFPPVEALAVDMRTLSASYGRTLDGVLGYSFLNGRSVLIDYPGRVLGILDRPGDATPEIQTCRKRWSVPMRTFEGFPVIPEFRLGAALAPVTLDTGSNGGISLYQDALDLAGVRAALVQKGEILSTGARGHSTSTRYLLNVPVGFGPFGLPGGETVSLRDIRGSSDTRLANVGNTIFAAMKLTMLLDYRSRVMTFYGDCR